MLRKKTRIYSFIKCSNSLSTSYIHVHKSVNQLVFFISYLPSTRDEISLTCLFFNSFVWHACQSNKGFQHAKAVPSREMCSSNTIISHVLFKQVHALRLHPYTYTIWYQEEGGTLPRIDRQIDVIENDMSLRSFFLQLF
jgi:hypothetical protein